MRGELQRLRLHSIRRKGGRGFFPVKGVTMSISESTRERIASLIHSDRIVLFMKGAPESPQCGFSARVVRLLNDSFVSYTSFDVLQDPEIRAAIKEYSSWPTIPQLYIDGEFIGGCDIVEQLCASGELETKLAGSPSAVA
jgi:monothiol glutaredoxin